MNFNFHKSLSEKEFASVCMSPTTPYGRLTTYFQSRSLIIIAVILLSSTAYISAQEGAVPVKVELFDGRSFTGLILEENSERVVLQTWTGDKSFSRTEILNINRVVTREERLAILRSINPAEDEEKWRQAEAGRKALAETPQTPKLEKKLPLVPRTSPVAASPTDTKERVVAAIPESSAGNPYQRLGRNLMRRMTLDLKDEELTRALALISDLTTVTIVVDPKIRAKNLRVTLKVTDMEAATVIRWFTRLTETCATLENFAVYVTEKPPEAAQAEALSNRELVEKAMEILRNETPRIQDFPGPDISLASDQSADNNVIFPR